LLASLRRDFKPCAEGKTELSSKASLQELS